ncbi:hypothetical protein BYT27DRAFT_7192983 [Phlegmacium glaucopus]|nr:hypothetical protein BYT27DRAFT_7192983 [Phlegmacium glaucopus]
MPVQHFHLSRLETPIFDMEPHRKAKKYALDPLFCEQCGLSFGSLTAFEAHMNSREHVDDYYDPEPLGGCYCASCHRHFKDINALNQHRANSPYHISWSDTQKNQISHDQCDIKCLFCKGKFRSPSGIALHIESGYHKITRHHVTAAVHAMQVVPNISVKRITGPVTPPKALTTYIASEASFNGSAYECYLCNKTFRTLQGLNAHLNSAAHDDDEFRCPKCKTEFKLISGLIQHLESGTCGLAARTQIDTYVHDLTDQFSRLLKI